jgi:hypothetical protein
MGWLTRLAHIFKEIKCLQIITIPIIEVRIILSIQDIIPAAMATIMVQML